MGGNDAALYLGGGSGGGKGGRAPMPDCYFRPLIRDTSEVSRLLNSRGGIEWKISPRGRPKGGQGGPLNHSALPASSVLPCGSHGSDMARERRLRRATERPGMGNGSRAPSGFPFPLFSTTAAKTPIFFRAFRPHPSVQGVLVNPPQKGRIFIPPLSGREDEGPTDPQSSLREDSGPAHCGA